MKHVTHDDLERCQTGTTDHPHAAATGPGQPDTVVQTGEPSKNEANPHGRSAAERAADAWLGQYPDSGPERDSQTGPEAK